MHKVTKEELYTNEQLTSIARRGRFGFLSFCSSLGFGSLTAAALAAALCLPLMFALLALDAAEPAGRSDAAEELANEGRGERARG